MRLIDADALLELYDGCEGLHVPVEVVIQNIKDMPTIEAEPVRHGHWNKRYYQMPDGSNLEMFWCSNCREEFSYDAETGISITDSNYCPHCGSRMDGKE